MAKLVSVKNLPNSTVDGYVLKGKVDGSQYWAPVTTTYSSIAGYSTISGISTYSTSSGIATNSTYATYATISGISTVSGYATNAGISTYSTSSGIATYATSSGIATYATSSGIATYATSSGIATYATNAGTSTSVIGGIASVTQLSVSGITTLGIITAGNIYSTGVITATSFSGTLSGYATSAGIATYATNAGIATYATSSGIATYASNAGITTALQYPRTFEITGDIVASPISFNGTGNVSLAATIQPNSVALGSDTTGDYVQSIAGTSNQISVSATSGEGSTPTLSIPNQFTIPQDATVTRDLQVNRNLNITGNITIGGTSSTIFAQDLFLFDKNIVLGIGTTNLSNADITTDNSANGGGIAIASTEGNPLVSFDSIGINTYSVKYKQIAWFNAGTFAGLGTDAWLINYAVGIGSTQFPSGTRLAAGNVQFTQNDLAVVRNINASGIITATTFVGSLTGNSSTATSTASLTVTDDTTTTTLYPVMVPNTGSAYNTKATTTKIRFDASTGNLALGNFSPSYALDAGAASLNRAGRFGSIIFGTAGTSYGIVGYNAKPSGLNAWTYDATDVASWVQFLSGGHVFYRAVSGTAGNAITPLESARFDSSGNLGIGTINPTSKLHIIGDLRVIGVTTSNTFTATDFNSTSDIKLKTNVTTISNSIEKINQLNGVSFNWKNNNKPSIGVIAQNVEEVFPELVSDSETKTVNYNGLIGVLIEAVKEQQKQINILESEIELLKQINIKRFST